MEHVVNALNALYGTDSAARSAANDWLQSYQKEPDAWQTSIVLLTSPDAPTEAKLFAAQTFRSKITYDLNDLDVQHRLALRDSLRNALKEPSLPLVVIRQVVLALSGLLLQLPEWSHALKEMVESLGAEAATVPALLEFLIVLPEEATLNGRIEVTNEAILTNENAAIVLALLPAYLGDQIPAKLRKQAFLCFASWLRAGAIPAIQTAASPVFNFAFDCLASDDLYEEASHAVCDLIHETQEVQENVAIIQQIMPRLVALQPTLAEHADDSDRMRALCKVFCEAGETYTALIVRHLSTFHPIVDAIALCAKNEERDVVRITFAFWWTLAQAMQSINAQGVDLSPLLQIYATLVDTIIGHLRYPADNEAPMTASERDDFREFRHEIGQTLRDCGGVLGAVVCLRRASDLIGEALANFDSTHNWQAIEAPLFSIRTMGATVDPKDDEIMPAIMDILARLPAHPRIRYAAILVIGRYTRWIGEHPEHIPLQLTFISSGFSDADTDVWLAAAQAMKFLCEDCGPHLVAYVPQLHAFIENVGPKIAPQDLREVSEGIAYVLTAMPGDQLVQALPLFTLPILEEIIQFIPRDVAKSQADKDALEDTLTRLSKYLEICSSNQTIELPPSCAQTAAEAWAILDELLLRQGHIRQVSEGACAVLRRAFDFFGLLLVPIAPKIATRLASSFIASGRSAYLWVTGRLPALAERAQSQELFDALRNAFESETAKVFEILPQRQLAENEDVIDDYTHLLPNFLRSTPDIVLLSPSLPGSIAVTISALSLLNPSLVRIGLDVLMDFLGHDCLERNRPATPQATALRAALQAEGASATRVCINGIITEWEDSTMAITVMRLMAERFPAEFGAWVQAGLSDVPARALSEADRTNFTSALASGLSVGNLHEVRNAFIQLDRMSRRAKLRAQMDRRRSDLSGV